jgi:hypothetical protein
MRKISVFIHFAVDGYFVGPLKLLEERTFNNGVVLPRYIKEK